VLHGLRLPATAQQNRLDGALAARQDSAGRSASARKRVCARRQLSAIACWLFGGKQLHAAQQQVVGVAIFGQRAGYFPPHGFWISSQHVGYTRKSEVFQHHQAQATVLAVENDPVAGKPENANLLDQLEPFTVTAHWSCISCPVPIDRICGCRRLRRWGIAGRLEFYSARHQQYNRADQCDPAKR